MLRLLLNALRRRKPPVEATYPDHHKFIEAIAIRDEPELEINLDEAEADDWAGIVQYDQDVDRIKELIDKRADLRRRHRAATHLDDEIRVIRQRMLEYEVRSKP